MTLLKEYCPILLITLLGFALRYMAGWEALSGDEANGVAIALAGSWPDMIERLREDGNPPLFYALLRLFAGLFGSSDLAVRLFSIGLSTALIPTAYLLLRQTAGPSLALPAALLMALCPPLLRYSSIVRMYSLLPLLSLASTLSMLRLLRDSVAEHESADGVVTGESRSLGLTQTVVQHLKRSKWWFFLYVLTTSLMLFCHHWGFFVVAGQGCAALIGLLRRTWSISLVASWLVAAAIAGAIYAPWLQNVLHSVGRDESPWASSPSLSHLLIETPPGALIGILSPRDGMQEAAMIFATLWMGLVFIFPGTSQKPAASPPAQAGAGAASRQGRGDVASVSQESVASNLLKYVVVFGLIAALLLSAFKPAWRDRYLVAFTPMVLILICMTIRPYVTAWRSWAVCLLPAVLWLPVWLPQYLWMIRVPEAGIGAIVNTIHSGGDKHKDLVVVSWEAAAPAVTRLLAPDIRVISFPDLERVNIIKWDGMNRRIRDENRMKDLISRMESALADGGTIWLVDSAHSTAVVAPPGVGSLDKYEFRQMELIRMDQIRTWLRSNAEQRDVYLWSPGRDMSLFLSCYRMRSDSPLKQPGSMPDAIKNKPQMQTEEGVRP